MENKEKLTAIKNELLVYITTTKSNFLTVETIEAFKNQINETENEAVLLKIKKNIEAHVKSSKTFDISADKQRTENLKRNKYSPENPYV